MVNSGSTVKFINNCIWSIVRAGGGVFALFPINESSNITLEFVNSDFYSTNILVLTGGAVPNEGRVNIKILGGNYNTNFISIGADNNPDTNNKISLSIMGVNTIISLINNVLNISEQFFMSRFEWTNFPLASNEGKGLVNQANVSVNSALPPGTTYAQDEILGILTELRDLKSKLKTAGILAT